eukprot:GCRY01000475.1.p1 GENE.GCRY01000475.1~~GCRY01000475.1.p1  ORF type:complete len:503 (+),score=111.39 GCRY01000475.1:196-1704(+)
MTHEILEQEGVGSQESSNKEKELQSVTSVPSPDSTGSTDSSSTPTTPAIKKRRKDDFLFGKTLGEGSFGQVVLATEIETGKQFAVKILDKKHIVKHKKIKYVTVEKEIMMKVKHPNIVRLYYTFQDQNSLYFVMELCEHGELLDHIKRLSAFDLQSTQFYTAEIISALEKLHSHGIIHRDLKPENLLLGEGYHLKLTDFGTGKEVGHGRDARSASFCGTPEYVSPELLRDKMAGKSSDLWALGCIVYQLLAGRPPFRHQIEYQLFQKIMHAEFSFPDGFPEVAKDLVTQLLTLDPEQRLGVRGGFEELKKHPFFEGIDFDNLLSMEPPKLVPFLPSTNSDPNLPGNGQCFDDNSFDGLNTSLNENDSLFEDSSAVLHPGTPDPERMQQLQQQKTSKWAEFLHENELLVKTAYVSKRKGLFSKKRQLLLTDFPRLFYVDPDRMEEKGTIPWTPMLRAEVRSGRVFFVHTPKRTYYFDDVVEQNAEGWVKAVNGILEKTTPISS